MFWRKKKPPLIEGPSNLHGLARRLGVERRAFVRVRYPLYSQLKCLPQFRHLGERLTVHDLSIGGCCLLDAQQFLGPTVGNEVLLELSWLKIKEMVSTRIVSRIHHRRHIQFLNLSAQGLLFIKSCIDAGARGLSVCKNSPIEGSAGSDIPIDAVEFWSAPIGDHVIIEHQVHRVARIGLKAELYEIFRGARPINSAGAGCGRAVIEQLILFICNIPSPSPSILDLLLTLEQWHERQPH